MSEVIPLDQSAFMVTFTGVRFNLMQPRIEDIRIEDIAHALSQICRFTGHTRRHYSVASHCILASLNVAPQFALEALLHDADEAYVNDLSRPLKHHPRISGYLEVEETINRAIRQKWGLPLEMSPEVKKVDNQLVCDEAIALMAEHEWTNGHDRLGLPIPEWSIAEAEHLYLSRFHQLRGR